jgi:CheY-like chemotaxis protein
LKNIFFTFIHKKVMLPLTPIDIYVVDDNQLVRTGIVRMLENENFIVKEFDKPRKCISELFAGKTFPRLIVSDYDMPEMSGMDILQTLKSSPHHKHLPILIVSAQINPELRTKAIKAGAVDWVQKSSIGNNMLPAVKRYILRKE